MTTTEKYPMADYQVELSPDDNGTIMARITGMPGATFGATRAEAIERAEELAETLRDVGLLPAS